MSIGFNEHELSKIISYKDIFNTEHITKFSNDLAKEILDYNYTFIIRNKETQWMFDRFSDYLIDRFPLNNIKNHDVINMHEFPTNGKFSKHIDIHRESDYYLIIGCTLNSNYKGGYLTAHEPYDLDLCKYPGYIYEMYATRPHEVTLITEGVRYSLVLFLTRENLGISKSII